MQRHRKMMACALLGFFIFFPFLEKEKEKEGEWFPFYIPWNYCEGSRVDFSFLLDPPAGKYGFLESRDGHLYFQNGKRARFWGVNIHSNKACFPTHKQAEDIAKRLAQLGCNAVRMHFLDNDSPHGIVDSSQNDSQHFSASQMERLDYFLYQLKGNGIYVVFDVLGLGVRKFKQGDEVADYRNIKNGAAGISFFDPRIIELSKKFSLDFLSHKNPYTGNRYIDEPAIAMIELTNENTLFADWIRAGFTPYYIKEIEDIWKSWLKDNGLLASGSWFNDRRFMFEIEDRYRKDMLGYLRSIGVKCPIGASNMPYNNLVLLADSQMDFTDIHPYWDLAHRSVRIHNRPLIKQSHLNPNTIVNIMASAKVKGKPLVITEWGSLWPNDWRAVDILTTASYAALNDIEGLFIYAYNGGWEMGWDGLEKRLYYDTVIFNDPAKMGLFHLGAMIFLGEGTLPSHNTITVSYARDELFNIKDPYEDRKGLAGIAYVSRMEKRFDPDEEDRITHPKTENQAMVSSISSKSEIASDTGQIFMDPEKGIFTLKAPKVFSFSGFIEGARDQEFKGIRFSSGSGFATFTIASLDGNDLTESGHFLLTVVGRARNTGQKIAPHLTKKIDDLESDVYILDKGKEPILAEGIEGHVFIENKRMKKGIEIFCLDERGLRKSSIQPEEEKGGFSFNVSTAKNRTIYYEIIRK